MAQSPRRGIFRGSSRLFAQEKVLDVTESSSRFWQRIDIDERGDGYETRQVITMKKTLMLLALSFALSAPVGGVALTLVAGTTAIMKVHPQQALAELRLFRSLSAQPVKAIKEAT